MKISLRKLLLIVCCFLLGACDKIMLQEKDIKFEVSSFPPKLVVTAMLDGANGNFSITLSEGRSLADYKSMQLVNIVVKRNGSIRLFEEGVTGPIWSESGIFTLPAGHSRQDLHRIETSGIVTYPGRTYRLEVEVDMDGYTEKVTATSTMPHPPVFSATVDTTEILSTPAERIYYFSGWDWNGTKFWPVTLNLDKHDSERSYYTVEINNNTISMNEDDNQNLRIAPHAVYVSDLLKLQDNPEKDKFLNMISESVYDLFDMFSYSSLLTSSLSFPEDNPSLTLYTGYYPVREDSPEEESFPSDSNDRDEEILYQNKLILRVKQITEATFKYYRSWVMYGGYTGGIEPPENIEGSIKEGYGCFMLYNSAEITLLDYQIYR